MRLVSHWGEQKWHTLRYTLTVLAKEMAELMEAAAAGQQF